MPRFLRNALVAAALLVEGLAVLLTLAGLPAYLRELSSYLGQWAWLPAYGVFWDLLMALVFFSAAGLILYYRRFDGLAVLLSLALVALGATETGFTAAFISPEHNPAGVGWRDFVYALRSLAMASALLLLYIFPDGRFVPGWTRPLAVAWTALNVAWFFIPTIPFNPNDGPTWRATPLLSMLFGVAWFATGIVAQVIRYRRASDPLTRQQTKWTAAGMLAAVIGTTLYYGLVAAANSGDWLRLDLFYFLIRPPLRAISVSLFPICLGVAVLKFRLWELDVIVNRALVYTGLTAAVAAIYILVVGGLGALLQGSGGLPVALLGATLAALLFQPLRSWLQGRVDRLMYGQRRDPYRVLTELGRRLDSTLEPDAVLPAIVETVLGALRLPYVAIELQSGPGVQVIEQAGRPPQDRSTLPAIPLLYQGILIGRLVAAPRSGESELSPDDRRLLQDLALQAGVAVHAVQVTADLRQARRRLIDAREEERGRLRRDLHDGLGARLAGQTLALDAVRSHIERDPEQAIRLVDALRSQAQEALAEIRELIDGLRPAALDDLGLEAALVELAGRLTAGQALHIEVEACLAGIELPPAIESAAYRIAQEALNNVARHSGAAHCRVEICVPFGEPACLRLEVFDDGHGLPADYRPGIGLRSMADRAAAAGGRLQIQAAPGGGVQVLAELPLKPHKELHPAERQP